MKQILLASHMYATDNNDYLAHPGWGGDLTGPDCWAYATKNNGRWPGGPGAPQSCAGWIRFPEIQQPDGLFFRIGQLGPFLTTVKVWNALKDVAIRGWDCRSGGSPVR